MGEDEVSRFLELLKSDPDVARELASGDGRTVDIAEIMEAAARHGCRFSADEFDARLAAESRELSDEDLDGVSGGALTAGLSRSYTLTIGSDGSSWIRFGDGVHGSRPPKGSSPTAASYRSGGGSSGNT